MNKFTHLHTHSHFSLLDGLSTIPMLCERALEMGQDSLAITDHGSIAGIPELFRIAKSYGIKPIAGLEAYFCEDTKIKDKTSETYHLTLLAQNLQGYKNLCKLVTRSYEEGFYSKPRIDIEMIRDHNEGLIILSGCMNSIISQAILRGDHVRASNLAFEFAESTVAKGNFYLEYMDSNIKEQKIINLTFDRWRKQYGYRGVVTQDSHYVFEEDKDVHQTLLCVGTRSSVKAPKFTFNGGPYDFCEGAVLGRRFNVGLLTATQEIADRCENYDIPKTGDMPVLSKDTLGGKSPVKFLENLAWEGAKKRGLRKKVYHDRLRYELTTVYRLNYATYFIVVHDILKWARSQGILVGPGRGSSAGSLLAYCLQITDLDPIKYGLYFERFLNEQRVSPPDIDVDVADSGRQQVLQYIRKRYGEGRVAHIGSFSAMGPRQSIRDVAIAHGMEGERVNQILKEIGHDPMLKFEDVIEMSCIRDNMPSQVIEEAKALSGKYRHMSTHAAGIIISNQNLKDHIPLTVKDGNYQTMYDMEELDKLGYVKFDILGLKTLGVIDKTLKAAHIRNTKDMYGFGDSKVYDLISAGNTMGVFQLEGWGYVKMIKRYKPQNFEDLMMINALYRPGPMQGGEGLETILRRRNGEEDTIYKHSSLEPILQSTYGLPVFQEQVMHMCEVLAGFTLQEADSMRSAIGKKDESKMASYRIRFIRGCLSNHISRELADELWEDITFFNRYGWNRAHAAAYGAVTYATAWLKTYHKEHFMAELLNSENDAERTKKILGDCHRMDVQFIRVDINESQAQYTVKTGTNELVPGFTSIHGVGDRSANAIVAARGLSKFRTVTEARDMIPRKLVNKTAWTALERAGAFYELTDVLETVPF